MHAREAEWAQKGHAAACAGSIRDLGASMGGLLSVFHWNRKQQGGALERVATQFDTGDVVLFAGRGVGWYLTKIGTWSGFSNVGFLIRDKPGLDGLLVCYSGAPVTRNSGSGDSRDYGHVRISRLPRFLEVGDFDLLVVRKLWKPLSAEEKGNVDAFARGCKGQVLKSRVSLLMAPVEGTYEGRGLRCCGLSCCLFEPDVERFFCSELVVGMLERVGRVVKNNNEYVPREGSPDSATHEGKVLGPAIPVRLPCEIPTHSPRVTSGSDRGTSRE